MDDHTAGARQTDRWTESRLQASSLVTHPKSGPDVHFRSCYITVVRVDNCPLRTGSRSRSERAFRATWTRTTPGSSPPRRPAGTSRLGNRSDLERSQVGLHEQRHLLAVTRGSSPDHVRSAGRRREPVSPPRRRTRPDVRSPSVRKPGPTPSVVEPKRSCHRRPPQWHHRADGFPCRRSRPCAISHATGRRGCCRRVLLWCARLRGPPQA